jgi:hypothetical protein
MHKTSRGKAGLNPEREGQKPILLRVKTLKGRGNLKPKRGGSCKRLSSKKEGESPEEGSLGLAKRSHLATSGFKERGQEEPQEGMQSERGLLKVAGEVSRRERERR